MNNGLIIGSDQNKDEKEDATYEKDGITEPFLTGGWIVNNGLIISNDENEDKKEDATYEKDVITN